MTEKYRTWLALGLVGIILAVFIAAGWAATRDVPAAEDPTIPDESQDDPCAGEPEDCEPLNWSSEPPGSYDSST